jgi:hypothetical protein
MTILEQVQKVAGFADQSSPMIHWSYVVFHKGEVWAQSARGGALAKTPNLDISVAVPAKKLLKALQAVGSAPNLTVTDNHRLRLEGGGSRAIVEGVRIKDMPTLHRPDESAEWQLVSNLDRVAAISWCVAKDPTRKHLGGLHFVGGRVEATNGFAMVRFDLGVENLPEFLVDPSVFGGLSGDQWVSKHGGCVFVADERGGPNGFRVGALIDAAFPPTDRILDGLSDQGSITADRAALVEMFKRAKLSNDVVALEVKSGRFGVEVEDGGQESLFGFASSIPFEPGEKDIQEGRIGFSLIQLLPMVSSATSDTVELHLTPAADGGLDPLLLKDGPYTGVVMPYRL